MTPKHNPMDENDRAVRNEAIEQCAQVVETKTEGAAYPLTVELARQMAAAIRALKDKPVSKG